MANYGNSVFYKTKATIHTAEKCENVAISQTRI